MDSNARRDASVFLSVAIGEIQRNDADRALAWLMLAALRLGPSMSPERTRAIMGGDLAASLLSDTAAPEPPHS